MTAPITINKDTTIQEALALGEGAFSLLGKYFGPGCLACGAAAFETLEMACLSHGLKGEDVSKIVNELQALAKPPVSTAAPHGRTSPKAKPAAVKK